MGTDFIRCPFTWMLSTPQIEAIKALRAGHGTEAYNVELTAAEGERIAQVALDRLNLSISAAEAEMIWCAWCRISMHVWRLESVNDDHIVNALCDVLSESFEACFDPAGFLESVGKARLLSLNGGFVYQMILYMQRQERLIDELTAED